MNTGAEAVETAIKSARKWGIKRVPDGRAKILVASGNFHGRTTTIISFSDDPGSRADFGPFTPGFVTVPTATPTPSRPRSTTRSAFLVEPIQGEAGEIVPPEGYLQRARALHATRCPVGIADEIQSGLGRTGTTFACEHEDVVPDMHARQGARRRHPSTRCRRRRRDLGLFKPGEHGSTFGGNPLACAIGRKVVETLNTGEYQRNSAELGTWLTGEPGPLDPHGRARPRSARGSASPSSWRPARRAACERLMGVGVLAKDTHETTHQVGAAALHHEGRAALGPGPDARPRDRERLSPRSAECTYQPAPLCGDAVDVDLGDRRVVQPPGSDVATTSIVMREVVTPSRTNCGTEDGGRSGASAPPSDDIADLAQDAVLLEAVHPDPGSVFA